MYRLIMFASILCSLTGIVVILHESSGLDNSDNFLYVIVSNRVESYPLFISYGIYFD